ncbi:hypothetical protein ACE1TI_06525 [Alteribacillus sp. JSM 102045]|uniref:hypothetical protein n=1 Tax=Alteribacillus sp. JSM 102045 TaxID=1562101 RepID=UPI0035C0C4E0
MHMQALEIRNIVYKQTKSPHPKAIEDTPSLISYDKKTLYKNFPADKARGIEQFFIYYEEYINTYWKGPEGQIKKVFRKNSRHGSSEKEQITEASSQLLKKLDRNLVFFIH